MTSRVVVAVLSRPEQTNRSRNGANDVYLGTLSTSVYRPSTRSVIPWQEPFRRLEKIVVRDCIASFQRIRRYKMNQ